MHVPDAVLDPAVAAAAGLIGAAGLGYAAKRVEPGSATLLGSTAAFVFAAQMVNFPIGPLPVSGHLLGGVLAAVVVGPWGGAVVVASVLIVQCLLFGDGGLTALGANFVNMGLIGSVLGYAIYAPIRRAIGGSSGVLIGAMLAAWFSVVLGAGAFAIELAASGRREDFLHVLGWMALVHAAIGVGEAAITGLVLRFVLRTRPDLIHNPDVAPGRAARWSQAAVASLAVATAAAIFLAPWASEHPDGLEFVGARLGFVADAPARVWQAPVEDYQIPLLARHSVKVATAVAGTLGTIAVFGLGLVFARVSSRRGRAQVAVEGVPADAA